MLKKFKYFTPIFAITLVLILSLVSCKQEPSVELTVDLRTDFEKSIMDKMGAEEGSRVLKQIYNPTTNGNQRAPITYNGELCPGVVNSGTVPARTCCGFGTAEYWYFSADAGDIVTIEVDRTNCEMDPAIILYEGFGDDTALTFVAGADDNDPPACVPACFSYADPILTGLVLPTTGVYTLAVWDFISGVCAVPPLTYDVVVTGHHCNIIIDGCNTGVANQTLPDGTTMQSNIDACAAGAGNHGDFVSCMAHLTNAWKAAGFITGEEKGAIQLCAAQSNIP